MSGLAELLKFVIAGILVACALGELFPHIKKADRWSAAAAIIAAAGFLTEALGASQ